MTESGPAFTPQAQSRERVDAAWIGLAQQLIDTVSRSPLLKFGWIILVAALAALTLRNGFYVANTTGTAAYYRTNKFTGSVLFCAGDECYPPRRLNAAP